jgi:murein DD-endopeptidase MepM/ murein hydrolase activator NlpD
MLFRGILATLIAIVGVGVFVGTLFAALEWATFEHNPGADGTASAGVPALTPVSLVHPAAAALHIHASAEPDDSPRGFHHTLRVARGDTLGQMLTRVGVSGRQANAAFTALKTQFDPRRIRVGEEIEVTLAPPLDATDDGQLLALTIASGPLEEVSVKRGPEGDYVASKHRLATDTVPTRASGIIENSLFVAGERAGVPVPVLVELIRAYSWDVDFQRDIRPGDGFEIMYDRLVDARGETVYHGDIRYAALTLSGQKLALYHFTRDDGEEGFFDLRGKSARKALLRTPVDGARISSGYGRRKHPILGYSKMHKGVDFAAPKGTPIYAAGNGSVEVAGRKGGYGKYVRIRHNGTYATAYAHMNGFAKGIRRGTRVKQGQVIGYVGTTGRSTGPHLHYEVLRDGRQMNPMKVKMPAGPKLKGKELERFLAHVAETDQQFAALGETVDVAKGDDSPKTEPK